MQARIGRTTLYRSDPQPHLDTTLRSLARLGAVWTVEPGSPMPPTVPFGPPAVRRRVPVRQP